MSVTQFQETEEQTDARPGPVQDPEETSALDRRIEQLLEAEMAKGLISSFHDDFDRLMRRLDAMSIAQHAAMDKLLRRLKSS